MSSSMFVAKFVAKQVLKDMKGDQKKLKKALRSATSRAGRGAVSEAADKVRETYTVKKKTITDTMRIKAGEDGVTMVSRGGNLPLSRFKTTPSKPQKTRRRAPLKAEVLKGQKKAIRGAFPANLGAHAAIAARVGKPRLPIKELYGPAVPVMLNKPEIREHIENEFKKRMDTRLEHEIRRLFGGS